MFFTIIQDEITTRRNRERHHPMFTGLEKLTNLGVLPRP
jgi:hypothetical protein